MSRLSRFIFWTKKGSFAVLDQGLVSTANFLVNILLARWLLPEEYGAFTVAFSVLLLLASFHSAIITEPMLVFGSGKYAHSFDKYMGLLIYVHFAIVFIISTFLGLAALVFRQQGSIILAQAFAGLALAAPFYLLLGVVRRAFYVDLKSRWATGGSALYLFIITGSLYVFSRFNWLSITSVLMVLGVSGLISSLALLAVLRPAWKVRGERSVLRSMLTDHLRYGKWAIGYTLINNSYGTIFQIIVFIFLGLKSVAIIRGIYNLVAPVYQFFTALAPLIVPWSVKRIAKKGSAFLTRDALFVSAVLSIVALIYWLFLMIFGSSIISFIYADKYSEYLQLIPFVALSPIFIALSSGPHVVFKAAGRSDLVFLVYLISSCISLPGAWVLIAYSRLTGALIAINLFVILNSLTVWLLWFSKGRRSFNG